MIDTDMCHREPVSVRVGELIRAFEDDHLNFDIPAGRMTGFVEPMALARRRRCG